MILLRNFGFNHQMKIALTGATGFIGNYIARELASQGHRLKCWFRQSSNRERLEDISDAVHWLPGELADQSSTDSLVRDANVVIHNAFWRPGPGFRGAEGDIVEFARVNILGTLQLIEASRSAGVDRFIFVSTCAVHEKILDDRPLDEAHPLWPLTHYGAHKAAIEKFVHSYGLGNGFPICAIRPTGVYGLRPIVQTSKWFDLIEKIVNNQSVHVRGGGKEVHAGDVAKAIGILTTAENIAGQSYACYDRYISQYEVAKIAKQISGSSSQIMGEAKTPRHQIVTDKLQQLGMQFGSTELLRETIGHMVTVARAASK